MLINKEERIKLRDEILLIFKNNLILISSKTNNYRFKSRNNLIQLLQNNIQLQEKYNLYIEQFNSEEEAIYCILHEDDFENHLCPNCNNICNFYNNKHGYRNTCGNKECRKNIRDTEIINKKVKKTNLERYGHEYGFQSKIIKEKIKQTNLQKYNVEFPMQNRDIREKSKQTCLEKYGAENIMQCQEIHNKAKKTNIEKYGVENVAQNKDIQEKIKNTLIERYGIKYPLQSKEIQNRMKNTNLERYGVEYAAQSQIIQDKIKQTCIKKYNVESLFQSKLIRSKIKETNLKRYGVEHPMHNQEIKEKQRKTYQVNHGIVNNIIDKEINQIIIDISNKFNRNIELIDIYPNNDYFIEFIKRIYTLKNRLLRLGEIGDIFNISNQSIKNKLKTLNLLNYFYIIDSNLELEFKKILDDNNIKYVRHDRRLYNIETNGHQEIDFLINDKIGIEINDINGHNIKNKEKYYHYNKTIKCNERNIRLIHIWEWEITNNLLKNKISKWILNICNNNKIRIFARKCIIKEISIKEEKEFINEYHLQGYIKSEVCYGLYYNEELLEIMSFGTPRYNKNYQWELLRLCTKYGYVVIGGAQKLLKKFIKNYKSQSIISYCNLDKFDGNIYKELGFQLLKKMEPSIIWYNEENGKHFSQTSLNKIGADKLLKTNYGKGTNNEEIAYKSGYQKVYNCGLSVYVLNSYINI